jgi:hypothetical protein
MDLLLVLILLLLLFGGGGGLYWGLGAGWGLGPIGLLVLVVVVVYLLFGYRGRRGPRLEKKYAAGRRFREGVTICARRRRTSSQCPCVRLLQRPCQAQSRSPRLQNKGLHARERRA